MYWLFNERFLQKLDPMGFGRVYWAIQKAWWQHPVAMMDRKLNFFKQLTDITLQTSQRFLKPETINAETLSRYDERFQDKLWFGNPLSDFVKEYYLLCTRYIETGICEAPGVDKKTKKHALFWAHQFLNVVSPSNFFPLNPQAIHRFYETGGKSVWQGLHLFAEDFTKQNIKMVDVKDFYVGKNLATTEGAVIYKNKLMELIQYTPKTDTVYKIPIVIAPPWINKFYVLDLTPKKSLVNFLVHQGYSVFMISWKNPDRNMRKTTFYDYAQKGIFEAIQIAMGICQTSQVHAMGYCIGGTALTALQAYLNAKMPDDNPIAHWTLLGSLTDFSKPGDIDVFIDEFMVDNLENLMRVPGYLDSRIMENSFRLLRSNRLVWHYFVEQYLYGKKPPAMDVLFWNTDGTRMPQAMYSFYLRELYLNNNLIKKDALSMDGYGLWLKRITQPLYIVGAEKDHITPWQETFKTCAYVSAPTRYVLASNGHVLGIVAPPVDPPKRKYWVGDATGAQDPQTWLATQNRIAGSWWLDWIAWLSERCGSQVPPPSVGSAQYEATEPAPGSYVLER